MMRVGFALGNIGPIGTAQNLVRIAQHAEALGYDSLWTVERLLWPVAPQTPYGATPDGSLPGEYKRVLDPLDALTFVAGHTKTIALGTSGTVCSMDTAPSSDYHRLDPPTPGLLMVISTPLVVTSVRLVRHPEK
jgi:alkanesulfonate monooxygenase SsuD/methylene tetrahydromethanopterin reductase-like flavin-dependent oxidoreductase (luciferase family)